LILAFNIQITYYRISKLLRILPRPVSFVNHPEKLCGLLHSAIDDFKHWMYSRARAARNVRVGSRPANAWGDVMFEKIHQLFEEELSGVNAKNIAADIISC